MIMKNEKEEINADKLSELWDEGCENDTIDPGDLFEKTINYCYKLESKIASKGLTEHQFHTVWTEAVGRDKYSKELFQNIFVTLKEKGLINDNK